MAEYNEQELQYLQMMQDNITRMASNSLNSKTWMVTIVAAFLAIGCKIEDLQWWLLLALIPIVAFWYFDALYLKLERQLRNREQQFINLKRGKGTEGLIQSDTLFDFRPLDMDKDDKEMRYRETSCQMLNKSVWPLYVTMMVIVIAITLILVFCYK